MRVLIVEDNALLAMSLELCLLEAGHQVIGPCPSASEAILAVAREPADLALIDIQLKDGARGVELARALKRRLGLPSYLLTAQAEKARAAGDACLGYFEKPYAVESVLESVELAPRIRNGQRPAPLPRGLELLAEGSKEGQV